MVVLMGLIENNKNGEFVEKIFEGRFMIFIFIGVLNYI